MGASVLLSALPSTHAPRMSRYPSAHGHTPSYRSLSGMSSTSPTYPSALGARDSDFGTGLGRSGLSGLSGLSSDIDREFSSLTSSLKSDPLLKYGSGPSGSSTSYQASSYSSKQTSSSTDGGVPHVKTSHDSTYKSTRTGDSGIPHSSYSHSSSSFDSDRPYGNRHSNFSYNI